MIRWSEGRSAKVVAADSNSTPGADAQWAVNAGPKKGSYR